MFSTAAISAAILSITAAFLLCVAGTASRVKPKACKSVCCCCCCCCVEASAETRIGSSSLTWIGGMGNAQAIPSFPCSPSLSSITSNSSVSIIIVPFIGPSINASAGVIGSCDRSTPVALKFLTRPSADPLSPFPPTARSNAFLIPFLKYINMSCSFVNMTVLLSGETFTSTRCFGTSKFNAQDG